LHARHLLDYPEQLRYYEAMMRSFSETARFFISTDSQEAFQWLQTRFGPRVFQRDKSSDDRVTLAGVREGFIDMLLLSRCAAVIGTGRSSFSLMAALAGRRPVVQVRALPSIPANWPAFNRWRWIWAYRHFFVETTVWQRWWFFSIRPQILRIPKIPGRCWRSARQIARKLGVGASAAAEGVAEQ
jgi:hypothetical protein